jgi:predicted Zn-dependent protease
VGVVSMARLDVHATRHERSVDLLAVRSYKLILKSIARVAGYSKSDGCLLAFPRNLAELDRKSPQFCAADHAVLVSAGILKSKEGGGCATIAEAVPLDLVAFAGAGP